MPARVTRRGRAAAPHVSPRRRGPAGNAGTALRNGGAPLRGPRGRVRRIVTVTDRAGGVLRRRSRTVAKIDASVRRLIADMAVTMRHAEGVGLAAVQIGVPLRVLLADTGRGLLALINPRVRRESGAEVGEEGCLSIPGVIAPVRRATSLTLDSTLVTGARVGLRATGYLARILQHEIDHLNGVLFLDRVHGASVRRRPLRPAERRRGAKPAAAPGLSRSPQGATRRAASNGRPRASAADRWAGSTLTILTVRRPTGS